MDTSLVNVDLHPLYVRLDIKGKITQLKFDEEILVDKSKVQRSQTTGALLLTMPKASISEVEARNMRVMKAKEDKEQEDKIKALERA
jgi:protein TilB